MGSNDLVSGQLEEKAVQPRPCKMGCQWFYLVVQVELAHMSADPRPGH